MRIFGAPLARRIIFSVMLPALFISYVVSSLFYMGSWQGFEALTHFNLFVARIAAASFMAYALGQILDVHVFNRLRQNHRWWMAPTASTLFGNVSDTLAFFFIAFWRSPDAFMAELDGNRAGGLLLQGPHQHCFLPADVRRAAQYAAEKAGR